MVVDVEMGKVVQPRGAAYVSVERLRRISGHDRMGPKVALLISEDLESAGISHLPVAIPQDQREKVLLWLWHQDSYRGMSAETVAPYLNAIRELAQHHDLDRAAVRRLAEATDRALAR